jgi:hypothetical protein
MIRAAIEDARVAAIERGDVETIEKLYKTEIFTVFHCKCAAQAGSLTSLRKLFELGCAWDWQTAVAAAAVGNLQAFEFAFRNGCEITAHCAALAALYGRVDVLTFILENKLPVDWRAPANASLAKHVACEQVLRDVPRDFRKEFFARSQPADNCAAAAFYHSKPMTLDSRLKRLRYGFQ